MLLNLHVKNLALIRECEVEFGSGLNILTGETGAGKSILLGSILLILGGKIRREMLRENTDYGLVELLFSIEDQRVEKKLADLEVYPEEGQIFLSRKVTESRSICRINGETCTLAKMRQAATFLLDIHGQNEHQSLLYPKKQLDILDEFGKEEILPAKNQVEELYRRYSDIKKALSSNAMDEEQRKREISFLEFEINEIQEAAPVPGEDEELERQYRKLNNSRKIGEAVQQAHSCTGYEGQACAGELVGQALHSISGVSGFDPQLEQLEATLTDIDSLLNDFNRELAAYLEGLTFQEEDFYRIEERLNLLNNLKAKHGGTIEKVLASQKEKQERLEALQTWEENRKKQEKQLGKIREKLEAASNLLSQKRKQCGKILEEKIIRELQDLNFLDVRFRLAFSETKEFTPGGTDQVEYRISTNPGEPVKALGKVVSGGELSRIMLAIKTLLADKDEVGTLIFDEIDTGISGRTAQKVSEKLARIGEKRQVICITHLPQIASMADLHFLIEKQICDAQTITGIRRLDEEGSTQELARMLGGAKITDKVLESAREMKILAEKTKKSELHS